MSESRTLERNALRHRSLTPAARPAAVVLLLAALLLPVLSGEARAQTGFFFDEFGAGYKAAAMGQAFTAVADDYSACYYNPAGLTQIRGIFENASGYLYARPEVYAHFPGNEAIDLRGQPSSRGMFTGIASSLDLEETIRVFPWFRRFSFGLVSWTNLPEIMQYHAGPVASRPHFLRHDLRFQLLALVVSFGFEVTPWLSVGAGAIPSVESLADQHNFAAVNKTDDVVMGLRLSIHQTAKVFVVPVFGILIKPPWEGLRDRVSLGLCYRGENKNHHGKGPLTQYVGEEDDNGEPVSGIAYPVATTINLISFCPRQISAGLALRPFSHATLSYDLTWKEYSTYRTYLELPPDPPFSDTFTHRLGLEYVFALDKDSPWILKHLSRICLRGGYYYEPTPVPNRAGKDNIFDSDQDVFSTGLTVTVPDKTMEHDFELLLQVHRFRPRSRAAFIDGVYAYQHGIPIRDQFIPVEFGGTVWLLGANYTMRF